MKRHFETLLAVFVTLTALVFQQAQAETSGMTSIIIPPQTVEALRDDNPIKAKVQANLSILTDGTALGKVRLRFNGDVLILHALEGRNFYREDGERTHTELKFRWDGRLVVATVTTLEEKGCDIWDLFGSGVDAKTISIIFETTDGDITSVLIGR